MKYILPIGVVVIAVSLLILWAAGAFSSPVASILPVVSSTPLSTPIPSPISLITPLSVSTSTPAPIITLAPIITSISTPVTTPAPTPIIMASGSVGSVVQPYPTAPPTPIPTPRLSANPIRELPITVIVGQPFDVTISFIAPCNYSNSMGVADKVPDGWLVQLKGASCNPIVETGKINDNTVEYSWWNTYNAGEQFTAVYSVIVPAGTPFGEYSFSGNLYYFIAEEDIITEAIVGDQQVYITS